MKHLGFGLVLGLFLFLGFSAHAEINCERLVSKDYYFLRAQKNLGKKLAIKTHRISGYPIYEFRILDLDTGEKLAQLDINMEVDKVMTIGNMDVFQLQNRRKGLTDALLEHALNLWPETQTIETVLSDTNFEIAEMAFKAGASKTEAIQQTPAYKIRAHFGFTEFVPGSIGKEFSFSVRKPKN